jgi:hypothetical protein
MPALFTSASQGLFSFDTVLKRCSISPASEISMEKVLIFFQFFSCFSFSNPNVKISTA